MITYYYYCLLRFISRFDSNQSECSITSFEETNGICRVLCVVGLFDHLPIYRILMNKVNNKTNALIKSKLLIYALRSQLTICHSNGKEKNEIKLEYLLSSLSSWLIDNTEKHSYTLLLICMNASAYPKTTFIILYPHRFQEREGRWTTKYHII